MPPVHGTNDDSNDGSFASSRAPFIGNGPSGLRTPSYDNTTYILILLVVLIPIVFTLILCFVTYCIYRYNKRRPANPSINRSGPPMPTVIYNTQHTPFFFEELPPSYDSLGNLKKDPHGTITSNEQVQLTILPNSTVTHPGEVTNAAPLVIPSAPTPPPSYINIDQSNK